MAHNEVTGLQKLREGLTLNGDHTISRDGLNNLPLEHVATSINLVRRRILCLLQEGGHAARRVLRGRFGIRVGPDGFGPRG